MKKTLNITLIVLFTVAIIALVVLVSVYTPKNVYDADIKTAKSYSEIYDVIDKFYADGKNFSFYTANDRMFATTQEDGGFSKTNVQTLGLDEGDKVKTDGRYVYQLNSNGCSIVKVDNGLIAHESTIEMENYVPYEIFLHNGKLITIGGVSRYEKSMGISDFSPSASPYSFIVIAKTDVRIYDVTDAENPVLEKSFLIDGSINTARLIEAESRFIFMVDYNFYYDEEESYIPKISLDGEDSAPIKAENIYYYDDISTYSYLILGEIALDNMSDASVNAYLGVGGEIYVSEKNIFVATYDYNSVFKRNLFGWVKEGGTPSTRIIRLPLYGQNDCSCTRVEGRIKDRYSLDEYEGHLRVATTTVGETIYNNVFILNEDLNKVGEITNIAEGETIYAVRFKGETGSLVTFREVDPYFNLDLKDPKNPKISKGLKEEGVSYYIHYIGDTGYTVGVGKDSDSEGLSFNGLKVSIYDNNSGEAENVGTFVLEGECYADILYDPRALLYMENGLFAFTYQRWSYRNYRYQGVEQGLAVFEVDVAKKDKLTYRGTLTNLGEELLLDEWTNYYDSFYDYIQKSVYIDNYIYTFSDSKITSYRYDTLEKRDCQVLYEKPMAETPNDKTPGGTEQKTESTTISSWQELEK